MNWFQKHLNLTLIVTAVGTYLPIMVTFAPAETTGQGRSVVGLLIQLVNPTITNETMSWFYLPIWLVLMFPVEAWVLSKKKRSLWHLLWTITPLGWIIILCLKNQSFAVLTEEVTNEYCQEGEKMTYEEYINLRKIGKIRAGINKSTALKLIDYLPKRYQFAYNFWSWVWMLSIPGFICVAIFIKWWIGLSLLFFLTPTISFAVKKSAAEFVLEYMEQDKVFFEALVKDNILTFKMSPKP